MARHLCTLGAEAFDCAGRVVTLRELYEAAHASGRAAEVSAEGHWGGSPRSVAFDAQWFRVAVDPGTGEMRILRSVHAADAGKVMNPMQCLGQVEGGVAQALGATLFETVRVDERGEVTAAAFRRYRLPQYADVPRTEVHFMEGGVRACPGHGRTDAARRSGPPGHAQRRRPAGMAVPPGRGDVRLRDERSAGARLRGPAAARGGGGRGPGLRRPPPAGTARGSCGR